MPPNTPVQAKVLPFSAMGRGVARFTIVYSSCEETLEFTIEEWSRMLAKPGSLVDARRMT